MALPRIRVPVSMRILRVFVVLAIAACASPSKPRGPASIDIGPAIDSCVKPEPETSSGPLVPPTKGPRASLDLLLIAPTTSSPRRPTAAAEDRKLAEVAIDFAWVALPDDAVVLSGELAQRWTEHREARKVLREAQLAVMRADMRGPPCAEAKRRESEKVVAAKVRVHASRARFLSTSRPMYATKEVSAYASFDVLLAGATVEEEEADAIDDVDPERGEKARAIALGIYERAATTALPVFDVKRFWARYGALRLSSSTMEQRKLLRSILAADTPTTLAVVEARYRLGEIERKEEQCQQASETYRLAVEGAARDPAPFATVFRVTSTLRWAEVELCLGRMKSAIAIAAGVFDLASDVDVITVATDIIELAMARLVGGVDSVGLPSVPLPVFASAARAVADAARARGDERAATHALDAVRKHAPAHATP